VPAPVGRPPRYRERITRRRNDGTEESVSRLDVLCEELARGASIALAASVAGLSPGTVGEYLARGAGTDSTRPQTDEYVGIAARIRAARAQGEQTFVRSLLLASVPRPVTTVINGWRDVVVNEVDPATNQPVQRVRRIERHEERTKEEFSVEAVKFALTHQYGWKATTVVEQTGDGPADVDEQADRLRGEIEAWMRGFADGRERGQARPVIDVPALDSYTDPD